MLEKEAFSIVVTIERMHWILVTSDGSDLFTGHHNRIFLLYPLAVVPDLCQTFLRYLLQWDVNLSKYSYTLVHIKGVDILWVDLLGIWYASTVVLRSVQVPVLPSSSTFDFECLYVN